MRISRKHSLLLMLAVLVSSLAAASFSPTAPEQVSVGIGSAAPVSGDPEINPDSDKPALCANADILAFQSQAANLVENDTNVVADIFLSRNGGALTRVSVGADANGNEVQSNAPSEEPAISPVLPDGAYAVAFTSQATNLVPNLFPVGYEGYGPKQVYIRIPRIKKTVLVSAALPGGEIAYGNGDSSNPSITSVVEKEGSRYIVTFQTYASNIAPDSAAQAPYPLELSRIVIAIIDGKNGEILSKNLLLPVDQQGVVIEPTGDMRAPVVNGQGDAITFLTNASNLGWTTPGPYTYYQVALATKRKDSTVIFPPPQGSALQSQSTPQTAEVVRFPTEVKLISKMNTQNGSGEREPGNFGSFNPVISFSGDYIAFATQASNFFGRTATTLALWDRTSDQLSVVNADSNGEVPEDSFPSQYALRRNGRLVLFTDVSASLTNDSDTNGVADLFAKDLVDGQITRLNKRFIDESNSFEEADQPTTALAIGGLGYNVDRSTVAFISEGNLVSTGSATVANVFRLNLRYPPPKLVANAPLQSPPDVTVSGRTCKVVLQRFSGISVSSNASLPWSNGEQLAEEVVSSLGTKVTYDIRLKSSSTKKTQKRTSTNVRVTLRNLKPGTYTLKYRAQGTKGRRTVSTKFSPSVSITIKR